MGDVCSIGGTQREILNQMLYGLSIVPWFPNINVKEKLIQIYNFIENSQLLQAILKELLQPHHTCLPKPLSKALYQEKYSK